MHVDLNNGVFVLKADYEERVRARSIGAKWEAKRKRWVVPANIFAADKLLRLPNIGGIEKVRSFLEGFDGGFSCNVPKTKLPLKDHQVQMVMRWLTKKRYMYFAEMGCVDGDAEVRINRAGKGFAIKLKDLFHRFHGGRVRGMSSTWNPSISTYIRSLCDGELRLNRIVNVLDKGIKPVVRITLKSGKVLRVTPDHEIRIPATGDEKYIRADALKKGMYVSTNGKWIDKDGYVRVGGLKGKHPRWTTGGVYEHILVMEKKLGRKLKLDERVHHRNEIKRDNRPSNLQVKTDVKHKRGHGRDGGYLHMNGGRGGKGGLVKFVPDVDTVVSVVPDGTAHVYDVVCTSPHRNFVANGIIVHNCGKTPAVIGGVQNLYEDGKVDIALVVAPLSVLNSWARQIEKFCAVRHRVVTLTGTSKARADKIEDVKYLRKSLGRRVLIWVLVNYEALRSFEGKLAMLHPGALCFDECFPAGTPVRTPHGDVPIEDLKPGDTVITCDPLTKKLNASSIIDTWERKNSEEFVEVTLDNGTKVVATQAHPFWVEGKGWVLAGNILPGDTVLTVSSSQSFVDGLRSTRSHTKR